MTIDDIKTAIRNLPQQGYTDLTAWLVGPERTRRQQEEGKAELVLQEREAGLRERPAVEVPADEADDPDAYSSWEDPGTIHDRMYGLGDRVCHGGRVWESTTPGLNRWEPGSVGVWRDVTGDLRKMSDSDQSDVAEPTPGDAPSGN